MNKLDFVLATAALVLAVVPNVRAQCRDDGGCRDGQVCLGGECADPLAMEGVSPAPTVTPPTTADAPPASAPVAEGTSAVTFNSDEPGVEVSELSTESWAYTTMCTTPCMLQLTPGPHYLKLGGWEANTMAIGTAQEWQYDSGQNAIWGWGVAGTVVGSAAMVTGVVLMLAPLIFPHCPWVMFGESHCAQERQERDEFYAGAGLLPAGAVLLALGIWGIVASEPVLNVTGTTQSADNTTAQTFALLPSVGPMPMGDGRTGWGFSLALTL